VKNMEWSGSGTLNKNRNKRKKEQPRTNMYVLVGA
jgi:hypothetical protein